MANAPREANRIPGLVGASSADDTVPVAIYADPTTHELYVKNSPNTTGKIKKYYTNAGAVTDGVIWSPAAGKRWCVTSMIINVSAASTVTLEDDLTAGDSAIFKAELAGNSGVAHNFGDFPLFSGEDAADLMITTTAGNVYVTVTGYEA
jgi:hypothetical protein